MQLKSLELHGFKSFAQKTVIDFVPGVTVVVGPNGSGKSNVVDAVRWVLAERALQSLRGRKGEDLIFHGSKARRATSRARVGLTLENTAGEAAIDAEEILIAREVRRGGRENSYAINGREVRLLDLEEFLSRSKVGAGSFRILSQGMSDLLLKIGPQELRSFVEEAAGLKEFQDKKQRSLKKMERTRANLEQARGLLAEIEPQLRFLRREAGKFARREEAESELKRAAVRLFGFRHGRLAARERHAAQKKKRYHKSVVSLEQEVAKLEKEFVSRSREPHKNGAEEALIALRSRDHSLARTAARLEGQLEVEKERARQLLPVTQEYLKNVLTELVRKAKSCARSGAYSEALKNVLERLDAVIGEINQGRAPEDNSTQVAEITAELKRTQAEQERIQKELALCEQESRRHREEELGIRAGIVEREKTYRRKNDELRALQSEIGAVELEEEKIAVRREQLARDIESVGVVTLSEVTESFTEKFGLPAPALEADMERKVFLLKRKLDVVGSIDPSVKDEYESVRERHDFLTREEQDLSAALTSLETMIGELEGEIEKRFRETLSAISAQFNGYIRLMFGGGSGKLLLVKSNGEERNSEGVDVEVDVPGKRIQSMGVLSGGERTLVSIALLFALVSVRKPPFLVLDEIDAALDEANSERFVRLVRSLAKDTQFVVITHNRETMRGADALYGVSIKNGVSQLLSLKIKEHSPDPV